MEGSVTRPTCQLPLNDRPPVWSQQWPRSSAVFQPFTVQGWSDVSGDRGPTGGDGLAVGRLAVWHLAASHLDLPFGDGAVSSALDGCGPEGQWLRQFGGVGRGLPVFT